MFSGIIEDIGTVRGLQPLGSGRTLLIETAIGVGAAGQAGVGAAQRDRIGLGDSVAVNGACLTVESVQPPHRFAVACGRETIDHTTLGSLAVGDRVHLERAMRPVDRLDGHIVAGHVDGVGTLVRTQRQNESTVLWVEAPPELGRYIAVKGSVAIDGVSLTVNELLDEGGRTRFRLNIIPFTQDQTRLAGLSAGARVNLEADVVARYLERLLQAGRAQPSGGLSAQKMAELGYGAGSRWSGG